MRETRRSAPAIAVRLLVMITSHSRYLGGLVPARRIAPLRHGTHFGKRPLARSIPHRADSFVRVELNAWWLIFKITKCLSPVSPCLLPGHIQIGEWIRE